MPTLNPYKNNPEYYIRAWTSNLGNINYKLHPEGWKIIDDWDGLPSDGDITWQQINALKSVGVVYTDDTGVIYPDDEKFQPDPDQINAMDLTEGEARSFLESILSNCNLSSEQMANLCQILDVEPPSDEIKARFEPAVKSIITALNSRISEGIIPIDETIPLSSAEEFFLTDPENEDPTRDDVEVVGFVLGPEDIEREDPEFEEGYDKNILCITITGSATSGEKLRGSLLNMVFFDDDQITAWSILCSQELTWEVRSELFGQISTMLPPIIETLNSTDTKIAETPTDFDISFTHTPFTITSN